MLPAIELPADLADLNTRLPPSRWAAANCLWDAVPCACLCTCFALACSGAWLPRPHAPSVLTHPNRPPSPSHFPRPRRYSFDHEADLDIAARFGAPAIRRTSALPKQAAAAAGEASAAAAASAKAAEEVAAVLRQHLPRIASPVTVLETEGSGGGITLGSAAATPASGRGTASSSLNTIDAAVAAALEEERQGAPAGKQAWGKGKPANAAAAAWSAALMDGAAI